MIEPKKEDAGPWPKRLCQTVEDRMDEKRIRERDEDRDAEDARHEREERERH